MCMFHESNIYLALNVTVRNYLKYIKHTNLIHLFTWNIAMMLYMHLVCFSNQMNN